MRASRFAPQSSTRSVCLTRSGLARANGAKITVASSTRDRMRSVRRWVRGFWALVAAAGALTVLAIGVSAALATNNDQHTSEVASLQHSHHSADGAQSPSGPQQEEHEAQQQAAASSGGRLALAQALVSRLLSDSLQQGGRQHNDDAADELFGEGPDEMLDGRAELAQADLTLPAPLLLGDDDRGAYAAALGSGDGWRALATQELLRNYDTELAPAPARFPVKRAVRLGHARVAYPRYSAYSRNNFDFGLGKRPDLTSSIGASGNGAQTTVLRFSEPNSPVSAVVQPVGQFVKRPNAHRYDFGLGKRISNPSYPRNFDFGLGKRAPNRVRYDFGLGR